MQWLKSIEARTGPSSATTSSTIGRPVAITLAFAKLAFQSRTAYRSAFWMTFANILVRMFAVGAVWNVLTRSKPDAIDLDGASMVSYAVLAVVIAQLLTWWDGPHIQMADRIKDGTIVAELRLPIYFPLQIFARALGDGLAQLIGYVIPAYTIGLLVFGLRPPTDLNAAGMFLVSLALGYILMFQFNFLLGVVAFYTMNLVGIQHAYHGLISLLSGVVFPIWLFPPALQAVAGGLPFRGLFDIPISLYIGRLTGAEAHLALAGEMMWVLILAMVVGVVWQRTYRHITIQGG